MKFFFTIVVYFAGCLIIKAQDIGSVIKQIEDRISKEKLTVSEILSDEKYMYLHAEQFSGK